MSMEPDKLKNIVEAALLAAGRPMSIEQILTLFPDEERPDRMDVRNAIAALDADYANRGIQVREVASGWRIQVREGMSAWLSRLWQDRPARYSRALLETLALIAYRQPITRGEIEDIRGVTVSSNIMRTLMERGWVRIVGHRDVPGRPGMYATTREFLDYFGLKRLEDLPPLAEIRDLDAITVELDLGLAAPAPDLPAEDAAAHEETLDFDSPQDASRR
jgi:segregation and condensation protein B